MVGVPFSCLARRWKFIPTAHVEVATIMSAQASDISGVSQWSPVHETFSVYRSGYDHFEQSMESLLAELDQLRDQLEEKADELHQERRNLAQQAGQAVDHRDEISRLTHQYEQQEARLAETQQELAQAHVELARMRKAANDPSAVNQSQKLSEVERERSELENELENVRSRAAELHETVSSQKHEMETQRTEMSGEIKQLRKILEKMASGSGPQAEAAALPATATEDASQKAPAAKTEGSTNDPVVNSVMAQFAKLQKDVAQRRARKKP